MVSISHLFHPSGLLNLLLPWQNASLSLDSSYWTLETYFTPEDVLNCLGECSAPLPLFHCTLYVYLMTLTSP